MRKMFLALALGATPLVTTPAAAVPVTMSYDFTGTDFTILYGGGAAPANPFTGSFSYTYDATTNTFVLTSFTGDVGGQHFGISDALSSVTTGALSIYGTSFGQTLAGSDFTLNMFFDNSTGQAGALYQLQYGTADFHAYQASDANLAAVPEPATWAMMLLGFLGIGVVARRRRSPALAQLA